MLWARYPSWSYCRVLGGGGFLCARYPCEGLQVKGFGIARRGSQLYWRTLNVKGYTAAAAAPRLTTRACLLQGYLAHKNYPPP